MFLLLKPTAECEPAIKTQPMHKVSPFVDGSRPKEITNHYLSVARFKLTDAGWQTVRSGHFTTSSNQHEERICSK